MRPGHGDLRSDWLHGLFGVLRVEAASLSADFGARVNAQIVAVSGALEAHPPSAVRLLIEVTMETVKIVVSAAIEESESGD